MELKTVTGDDGGIEWESTIIETLTPIKDVITALIAEAQPWLRDCNRFSLHEESGFVPDDNSPGQLFLMESTRYDEFMKDIEAATISETDFLRQNKEWIALNPFYIWTKNRVYFTVFETKRSTITMQSVPRNPCDEIIPLKHFQESNPKE